MRSTSTVPSALEVGDEARGERRVFAETDIAGEEGDDLLADLVHVVAELVHERVAHRVVGEGVLEIHVQPDVLDQQMSVEVDTETLEQGHDLVETPRMRGLADGAEAFQHEPMVADEARYQFGAVANGGAGGEALGVLHGMRRLGHRCRSGRRGADGLAVMLAEQPVEQEHGVLRMGRG